MSELLLIEKLLRLPGGTSGTPHLSPAQKSAARKLLSAWTAGSVLTVRASAGMGKTTVLKYIHARKGGALLGMAEFWARFSVSDSGNVERTFAEMIEEALADHEVVLVDDLDLVLAVVDHYNYDRGGLMDTALAPLVASVEKMGRTLVFASNRGDLPWAIEAGGRKFEIADFTTADYESICASHLPPETSGNLDYAKIHKFAAALTAHQLKGACRWPASANALTTELFIEYLSSINITSNVDLEEVQPVTWDMLRGIEDVIEALETKIVLAFENAELAAELQLKPKRGVLLAGPPGTGKTTIGRALAHRLKGKFFLIDGTTIAGQNDFFDDVEKIFRRAKRNAPSVVFIDDADLIFENNANTGFYRYLLTMLDGLESASAERVCVMMTAMEVLALPAALVRSGRVELWLETRLPDHAARTAIFDERLAGLPEPVSRADTSALAAATEGFTGADIKAVVEDGKLLLARDKATRKPLRAVEEYFLDAIRTVRTNRRNYQKRKAVRVTERVAFGFADSRVSDGL